MRAIYFDKTPSTNWAVSWHQDLLLAVRARADVPGFGPWSVKEGIVHVQPPIRLLEQMLTLRLHLDDANASNGPLRVLPGSHSSGLLSSEQIDAQSRNEGVLCEVRAGGALLMRPLLLHSSSRCTTDAHRRVIHIEYAGFELPAALEWSDEAGYGSRNNLPCPASSEI